MENDLISRSALLEGAMAERYEFLREKNGNYDHYTDGFEDAMLYVEDAPAVDAVSRSVFEQVQWERDVAMQQLKDHDIPFGGTAPDVVKVLLCAFCAKFDTSGYDNSNEDDFLLHVGHCKYWGKSTQGCGFCEQRERRADDARD